MMILKKIFSFLTLPIMMEQEISRSFITQLYDKNSLITRAHTHTHTHTQFYEAIVGVVVAAVNPKFNFILQGAT
jgi:hypothetical protein